jgi:hypothetical protein
LIGVVVVVAIESDVEITDDVYRLLEDGDSIEDSAANSSKNFCVTASDPGRYMTTVAEN